MAAQTPNLVEYKTEVGSYWVTAEDAALLREDMVFFGMIVVKTELEGGRAIGRRINPADLSDNFVAQNIE